MRKLFLNVLLLASFSGKGQENRLPFNAMQQSFSLEMGPSFVVNQRKPLGFSGAVSWNVRNGFGFWGGIRLGRYESPDLPLNYARNSLVSLGGDDNLVTDNYLSPYGLFTYEWFPPKVRFLFVRAGLGIAVTKTSVAHFKTHVSTASSGSILRFPEPTHDVSYQRETTVGPAAQTGIYTYLPLSKSNYALTAGLVGWSVAGPANRFFGIDIQLGLHFPAGASRLFFKDKR